MLLTWHNDRMPQHISVSDFDKQVNKRILANLGVQRMSGRGLAKRIGRSSTYVLTRLNEQSEWTLGDINLISHAFGTTVSELLTPLP